MATTRTKDHDMLVRIDERTASLVETLAKFAERFDEHEKEDRAEIGSLKRWRAYITGAVTILGSLGMAGTLYASFIK